MTSSEIQCYTAAVRWKKGEMEALGALDSASKDRLLPHVIFPPLNARDVEEQRAFSRDEFTLIQVGRLQRFWGGRLCLADFRFLQFDADDRGSDASRITELLVTSRKFGCRLVPVLDALTDVYRSGALAAHIRNLKLGGAIRIGLGDLQNDKLADMLRALIASIGVSYSECILILDLSDATISEAKVFAKATSEWLSRLHHVGTWKRIIVEASAYPRKNPAAANSEAIVPRLEWQSWRQLAQIDGSILNWAFFGDFGADHGQIDFDAGGRTIIHFRYATPENWVVTRGGGKPSADHDGTIRTVARRIVNSGQFMGEKFSAGDEFIARCAEGEVHGNASNWRWANMVHHMTLATSKAAELIGQPFEKPEHVPTGKQLSIFAASK